MKKTKEINIKGPLTYQKVFEMGLEILTQKEYDDRKKEENEKHQKFIDVEEWRKYIKWKIIKVEQIAVKIKDDKYEIKDIYHYSNNIKDLVHCQENLDSLFNHHPLLNSFKYDDYSKTKEFNGDKYDEDVTPLVINNFFKRNFDEWCPRADIKETITETLDNNKYNFLQDYFDGLVWDGVERLDTFLVDYYGAEDNPLVRAYFSRWMLGLVKRTYQPGAKFDSMLILASVLHGKKKTSLFEWLGQINGRKLYNDAPDDLRNLNELVYASKGKCILMFDDFDDICDKGQIGKVKSFITQRSRTAALKWQHDKDYPITYVLCGTTNNISILVDDGTFDERRFWIVEVNPTGDVFDIEDEIKDQLYAEAVYRYKNDPSQYLWIYEPELKQAEIEWQKKYKKANEDTTVERILNIFSRKYPITNGIFENEEQFNRLINQNTDIKEEDTEFFDDKNMPTLEYIKVIPSAWVTKALSQNARGTDRIIQILHTQGYKVEKKQRYWIYDKLLTVIIIHSLPKNKVN